MTLEQLEQSYLVTGTGVASEHWDSPWREHLVRNVRVLVGQLWNVGITEIFVDGSFVEDKDHPNDIDGYFVCDLRRLVSGDLQRDLNSLDPYKVWTWDPASRRLDSATAKRQLPMWHRYRVELFPHFEGAGPVLTDERGFAHQFPSAFRLSKGSGLPKGIVKLVK